MTITPGDTASVTHTVEDAHTAQAVGSGDLSVLGTPVVVAWCEEATCAALDLKPEQTSVGIHVSLDHVLASAVGSAVTASATVSEVEGRQVTFDVTAHDQDDRTVATGTVRRAVVDRTRFLDRVPAVG